MTWTSSAPRRCTKVEKLDEVLRGRPDLARRIQALDAVILQRGAADQVVAAYRVQGGKLCEPFFLPFGEIASQPRSAEQMFRNYLDPTTDSVVGAQSAAALPNEVEQSGASQMMEQLPLSKGELSEHLWLVARWFYSNPRTGEIFFREKNDWPYRRILRACSRLLAPPEPPKEPATNQ